MEFYISGDLQEIKNLGIVSITALEEHSKSKDTINYFFLLFIPTLFSLGFWYVWARKNRIYLFLIFDKKYGIDFIPNKNLLVFVFLILAFYLYFTFDTNLFIIPGWNKYVGSWILFGEEGENLAWIQSLLSGEVYGKDFFCLYGPMLIYPLFWVMKLFGPSILVARFYVYFLDLISYGIIIFFLYRTVRSKPVLILSVLFSLIIFPPFKHISINFTYFRFVIGILPLLMMIIFIETKKKWLIILMGFVLGQCFLFSHEVGISSFLTLISSLSIYYLSKRKPVYFIKNVVLLFLSLAISILPMLLYLSHKGALIASINNIFKVQKFASLGWGGLPFPSLINFVSNPISENFFLYWVIFLYILVLIFSMPRIIFCKLDGNLLIKLSLAIFGIMLFYIVVRRPTTENIFKVFSPAFLLAVLIFDKAINDIFESNKIIKFSNIIFLALFILSIFFLIYNSKFMQGTVMATKNLILKKHLTVIELSCEIPEIKRGGILYNCNTAKSLIKIKDFLDRNTNEGEFVYFFPNEAVYYFLFNRNNPTSFALSYFAISLEQRKKLISELEKNKPKYIIYSLKTWRVDNILEIVQVPEIVNYINNNYDLYRDLGEIHVLKRIS
jgi:hypothetical protein